MVETVNLESNVMIDLVSIMFNALIHLMGPSAALVQVVMKVMEKSAGGMAVATHGRAVRVNSLRLIKSCFTIGVNFLNLA